MSRFADMFECDVLRYLNREISAEQLRDKFGELIRWETYPNDPEWLKGVEVLMAEYDRGHRPDNDLRKEILLLMDAGGRLRYRVGSFEVATSNENYVIAKPCELTDLKEA